MYIAQPLPRCCVCAVHTTIDYERLVSRYHTYLGSSLKCSYFSYNIALHLAPPISAHIIVIPHFRLSSPGW